MSISIESVRTMSKLEVTDLIANYDVPSVVDLCALYNDTTDVADREAIAALISTLTPVERDICKADRFERLASASKVDIAGPQPDFWRLYAADPHYTRPVVTFDKEESRLVCEYKSTRLTFADVVKLADDRKIKLFVEPTLYAGAMRIFGCNLASYMLAHGKGVCTGFKVDASLWAAASRKLPDYFTNANRTGQKALVKQLGFICKAFTGWDVSVMYFDITYMVAALTSAKEGDITVKNSVNQLGNVIVDVLDKAQSFSKNTGKRTKFYTVHGSDKMSKEPKETKTVAKVGRITKATTTTKA